MRIDIIFITILTAVFYSGCNQHSQVKPNQKTEILLLSEQVKELNSKDKQHIYRSIQDDIYRYNEEGDEANENDYNNDAIKAYELVNFYEGYSYISAKKIASIKKQAKIKSILHYRKGIRFFNNNKKRSIAEFNIVMRNNPEYKDTQKKLLLLNSDRDIKIFVNALESNLHTKVLNCNGSIKELRDININLHKLLRYDYKNAVALKAKDVLKEYNGVLVNNAISLYDEGRISKSKSKFIQILKIYKNDTISLGYLKKIKVKKTIQSNLKLAQNYLNKKEYLLSIKYAYKVLKIDSNNKKAKKTIVKAKIQARKKVIILVKNGKQYYNQRKLDKSKKSFKAALKIDPYCNEALIYSKKIDRQLETIKSLE